DWYRGRSIRGDGWKAVVEKAPFFAGSLIVATITVNAQIQAGALAYASQYGPLQRVLFAVYGSAMYFVKFFAPFQLSVIYPAAAVSALHFALALVVLAVVVAAFFYFRNDRNVRFGLLFFAINIALFVQLFTFGRALMADRYTYLPYIGLVFALA